MCLCVLNECARVLSTRDKYPLFLKMVSFVEGPEEVSSFIVEREG